MPAARSEILKKIGAATFASFAAQYRANELAARLTRLLLPPPAAQTVPPDQESELPATAADDYFVV